MVASKKPARKNTAEKKVKLTDVAPTEFWFGDSMRRLDIGGLNLDYYAAKEGEIVVGRLEVFIMKEDEKTIDESIVIDPLLSDESSSSEAWTFVTIPLNQKSKTSLRRVGVKGVNESLKENGKCPDDSKTCSLWSDKITLRKPQQP